MPKATEISFNEGLLRLAIIHDKIVTFRYAKGSGSIIETRRLSPSKLIEAKGHTTVVGYDVDRDEPRAYRVDRIRGDIASLA